MTWASASIPRSARKLGKLNMQLSRYKLERRKMSGNGNSAKKKNTGSHLLKI